MATARPGWGRYKEAFCQETGASLFILGTRFHSYINVVEVRRSGIPASDLLHQLCSSRIDFHPTLWGGGGVKKAAHCKASRRHERAKRVGNAAEREKEGKEKPGKGGCGDTAGYAPEVRLCCRRHRPQSTTATRANG